MDNVSEALDLDIEDKNELLFKVQIEGIEASPAKVRLVCENTQSSDVGFVFNGRPGPENLVQFNLPPMKDKLKEGIYDARVEVMIENRFFTPVEFQLNFKRKVKVVAEAVTIVRPKTPEIKVTASPIVVKKPQAPAVVKETIRAPIQTRHPEKRNVEPTEDELIAAAEHMVAMKKKK